MKKISEVFKPTAAATKKGRIVKTRIIYKDSDLYAKCFNADGTKKTKEEIMQIIKLEDSK